MCVCIYNIKRVRNVRRVHRRNVLPLCFKLTGTEKSEQIGIIPGVHIRMRENSTKKKERAY